MKGIINDKSGYIRPILTTTVEKDICLSIYLGKPVKFFKPGRSTIEYSFLLACLYLSSTLKRALQAHIKKVFLQIYPPKKLL